MKAREEMVTMLETQAQKDAGAFAPACVLDRGRAAVEFVRGLSPADFEVFSAMNRGRSAIQVQNSVTYWMKGERR